MVDSVTFSNVKTAWLKELRENAPEAQILLVGTKADLRGSKSGGGNGGDERDEEVSMKKIKKAIKECGFSGYVETSARRGGADVDRVFHQAIRVAVSSQRDSNSGDMVDGQRRSLRGSLFSCFTT